MFIIKHASNTIVLESVYIINKNIINNIKHNLKTDNYKELSNILKILNLKDVVNNLIIDEIEKKINILDNITIKLILEESYNTKNKYIKKEIKNNFSIYYYKTHTTYYFKNFDSIINTFNDDDDIFNIIINNKHQNINKISTLKKKINNENIEFNFSIKTKSD